MRWEGRRQSTNVEDRRGSRPSGGLGPIRFPRGGTGRGGVRKASGGTVLAFVVVALGLWIFAGINPLQLLDMLSRGDGTMVSAPQQPQTPAEKAEADRQKAFIATVLAETEDTWQAIFARNGQNYTPPKLVLFTGSSPSGCGLASAAVGPFYCPLDQKVYIDLSFYRLLSQRLDAPGDFAQAYVLAHEVGHHVQNLTGVLGRFHSQRERMSERAANAESVKVELQADCYAGVWAHAADRTGIVEDGDIEEALNAAAAVGDDMMQRQGRGTVMPESFTHGSSEQRARWFRLGYRSGNPGDCNTFDALAGI